MEIFKILAICFVAAATGVLLKAYRGEYALALSVGTGCMLLLLVISNLSSAFTQVYNAFSSVGIDISYIRAVLKAVGIGYITQFIADTCRDAGQTAIASGAELAGRCAIFLISLPLLSNILEIAKQILL